MEPDTPQSSDDWNDDQIEENRNYPLEKQPKVIPGIDPDVSQDPNWSP
jgi:hypothetical protein